MRMSISAKSAASTPPAPARMVTTASRMSYSPDSRVRTSSSPRSLRIVDSSADASDRLEGAAQGADLGREVGGCHDRPGYPLRLGGSETVDVSDEYGPASCS